MPRNSGRPNSAAGSICQNLPCRGAARSGGMQTMAPTAATEAAKGPMKKRTPTEISNSPSAAEMPLRT